MSIYRRSFDISLFEVGDFNSCLFACCCFPCAAAQARSNMDGSSFLFNVCCVSQVATRWLIIHSPGICFPLYYFMKVAPAEYVWHSVNCQRGLFGLSSLPVLHGESAVSDVKSSRQSYTRWRNLAQYRYLPKRTGSWFSLDLSVHFLLHAVCEGNDARKIGKLKNNPKIACLLIYLCIIVPAWNAIYYWMLLC